MALRALRSTCLALKKILDTLVRAVYSRRIVIGSSNAWVGTLPDKTSMVVRPPSCPKRMSVSSLSPTMQIWCRSSLKVSAMFASMNSSGLPTTIGSLLTAPASSVWSLGVIMFPFKKQHQRVTIMHCFALADASPCFEWSVQWIFHAFAAATQRLDCRFVI